MCVEMLLDNRARRRRFRHVPPCLLLGTLGAALAAGCARGPCDEAGVCDGVSAFADRDAGLDVAPANPAGDETSDAVEVDDAMGDQDAGQQEDGDRTGESEGGGDAADFSDGGLFDATDADAADGDRVEAKVPVDCMPTEDGGCMPALFVAPHGSPMGDGTTTRPYGSLTTALVRAKAINRPVYACEDGSGFVEALTVDASLDGVVVHGGFDCVKWTLGTYVRTVVSPPSGRPALVIKGLTAGVLFERFEFRSADASASGQSSIAVIANAALHVVFQKVQISAGQGGDGQAGTTGTKGNDGPQAGPTQQGNGAACPALLLQQASSFWGSASLCQSRGGPGGASLVGSEGFSGGSGDPRTNLILDNTDPGNGGAHGAVGIDGYAGLDGKVGLSGTAAPNNAAFTTAGYTPAGPGGDGQNGFTGQGGGGGGASDATGSCIGASGGAGGMGGCGGTFGTGGASGGASVALLSWSSEITLDGCTLMAARGGLGGNGGSGGLGGLGQEGGMGGTGYTSDAGAGLTVGRAGAGGKGGNGGYGGPGAGGNGGPSFAIAFKGTAPAGLSTSTLVPSFGGLKGIGGIVSQLSGDLHAPNGVDGNAAPTVAIP